MNLNFLFISTHELSALFDRDNSHRRVPHTQGAVLVTPGLNQLKRDPAPANEELETTSNRGLLRYHTDKNELHQDIKWI